MTLYKKTREHLNSHWSWLRWSVSNCIVGCNLANMLQRYRRVPPTHSRRYRLKCQTILRFACRNPHHRFKEGKKTLVRSLLRVERKKLERHKLRIMVTGRV